MTETTPTRDETVLLPCPFCGGPAKMISCMAMWEPGRYQPDGRRITCEAMDCYGVGKPFYGADMEANAIAWWNRRASAPAPASGGVDAVRRTGAEMIAHHRFRLADDGNCAEIDSGGLAEEIDAALASLSQAATPVPETEK